MTHRDPMQIAVVLDAEPTTPIDEVIGRLPERDDQPRKFLLSGHRGGNIRRGQPIDWVQQADAVSDLVADARRAVPKDGQGAELYVWGQGPLPLFVQLGQELSDWISPLTLFGRRADGSWDELPVVPAAPLAGEQPFFDVVTGLDEVGAQEGGRLCVFVSTRGAPAEKEETDHFLRGTGEDRAGLVEIRTSSPRFLDRDSAPRAADELRRALAIELPRRYPRARLAIFVAGPVVLAFLVGRALQPNVHQPGILVPFFDRHEYQPALHLPWLPAVVEREEPIPVTVLLAYDKPGPREVPIHKELETHLRAQASGLDFALEILDAHRIEPGLNRDSEVRRMLGNSDIVVPLLSAEFRMSELGRLVEQQLATLRVVPVLERPHDLGGTPWQELTILPQDGRPLRSRRDREAALSDIDKEIRRQAKDIAANRQVGRDRIEMLAPKRLRAGTGIVSISEVLDSIEQDLQVLPRLRFTLDERYYIWERLVDELDKRDTNQNLRARLDSPTRTNFEEMQRYQDLKAPPFYRPEDPLGLVLSFLSPRMAARWLWIGAVEVEPTLSFPRWGSERQKTIAEHLEALTSVLTDRERRALERSQLLHHRDCQGLLAVLSRNYQEPIEELKLASEILADFRLGRPLGDLWRGLNPETIYSAALLNLLGSEALWRADLTGAERAYQLAQKRAEHDKHLLAEWVAVSGLVLAFRWRGGSFFGPSPAVRAEALAAESGWRRRREELEEDPAVKRVMDNAVSAMHKAERELVGSLQRGLANGTGQPRPPYELESLLRDQEELGEPPMVRGETAEVLGTSYLLQTSGPAVELREAVATLCRYGGNADERWRFFSAALDPLSEGFLEICADVLRPGRTAGEWMARLTFLHQYAPYLPLSLAGAARSFYAAALEQFQNETNNGIWYQAGGTFGTKMGWSIVDQIIKQTMVLEGHSANGIDQVQQLLDRPVPFCWQAALGRLHVPAWQEWFRIGTVSHVHLGMLAKSLVERLADPLAAPLFADVREGRGWKGFFGRDANIPIGLAKVLPVMHSAGLDPALIQMLHRDLCRMLESGMRREPELYQKSYFTDYVFKWLSSHSDEAREFLARLIDLQIERLAKHDTVSTYSEGLSCIAHQAASLNASQWRRLGEILEGHRALLLEDVRTRNYAVRPLLWLAASILSHGPPGLHDLGRDLIRQSSPIPDGLVAAVAATPDRLGDLGEILEQAVLHCLRGLTTSPMPWFSGSKRTRHIEDADEVVNHGLRAVHNRIHFHHATPPPSGWRPWLAPALAHAYSQNPRVAERAQGILQLALDNNLEGLDDASVVQALCWALSRPHPEVRDQALFTGIKHRQRLTASDGALEAALARFEPPPSISADYIIRIASLTPLVV